METTPVFRPRHLQVKMPRGLRELMADMSREVLRNQPDPSNIHKFLADYLDSLATIRTVTWITDNITSDVKTLSQRAMQRLIDKDLQIEDKTAGFKIIQDSLRKFCLHLVGSSVAETREKCINELVENLNSISDSAKMEGYVRNLFKYVFNVFLEQYLKVGCTSDITIYFKPNFVCLTENGILQQTSYVQLV